MNDLTRKDAETTVQDIKEALKKFRDERDWMKFHKPKDVAAALSIEAAELQELFLWKSDQTIAEKLDSDSEFRERVEEELADVFSYCLVLANALDWQISELVFEKMRKAAKNYPVEKAKGVAKKYNEL